MESIVDQITYLKKSKVKVLTMIVQSDKEDFLVKVFSVRTLAK